MREKKVNEDTVTKYIGFLNRLVDNQSNGTSLKSLVELFAINKCVVKACVSIGLIELTSDTNWFWCGYAPSRQMALELLDYLLEKGKKQIVTPISGLDNEIKGYIKAIHDHLISNSQNKQSGLDGLKTPLLSRALNQVEQSRGNTLFSKIENDEAKKFELLKAIAPGVYNASLCFIMSSADSASIESTNEFLIDATEDLYNKFFSKK